MASKLKRYFPMIRELEDASIANLEVQKIGYLFPGQRSACYSADLLLRQYKRIRGEAAKETGRKFSYRDIKNVYTIVLFEKSPKEFNSYPNSYYHFFGQKSDTGLEMDLLQKYLFIPLDIFRKNKQNVDIKVKSDAWLTLFSSDDPDDIIELVERYPEFRQIYKEAYEICLNIERVMDMFSEELYELDKNTVQYMIDEMQDTIDKQNNKLEEQQSTINEQQQIIEEMRKENVKSINNVVLVLRDLGMTDSEVVAHICKKYQMDEEQVRRHL